MRIYDIQTAFARGELSPRLHGRTDIDHYRLGLMECTNWYVLRQGALRKRPGTQFIAEVKASSEKARLVPFIFSTEQAYILEFGDKYFRVFANGGRIEVAAVPVEVVTPYGEADLFDLKFAQSADTLYVAHRSYAPMTVTRSSDTAWTIAEIDFQDGPYLQQPKSTATSLTFSADGNIIPKMTSNTLPSGVMTSKFPSAADYVSADRNPGTQWAATDSGEGWVEYTPTTAKVAVGCFLRVPVSATAYPQDFILQGWDGSAWTTLDSQFDEVGKGSYEKTYYPFNNETAYTKYRLKWTRNEGVGLTTALDEWGLKESPETMAEITCTASAVNEINGGQGFLASDVGRHIRFRGSDAKWRWFKIATRTSSTVVTGAIYGAPLQDLEPTNAWRIGAWSEETGYPASVSFFEQRLCWARTDTEPQKIWGSKSFGFDDHGVSTPLVADDAFSIEIASDQINEIKWISEASDLIIGTSGGIRTLGPSDTSKAFSATNVRQRRHTTVGSAALQPVRVGSVSLYADHVSKSLRELFFSFENNAFTAPELTILSDHLLASGIVDLTFAESPDSIVWIVTGSGDLVSLTFERDQRIVGLARHPLAGGSADAQGTVESIATIPGPQTSEVWLVVRRTINGSTRRFVERLGRAFEGMVVEDAAFLDSYLNYDGAPETSVSGLGHLEGETVGILADGIVEPEQAVSNGAVTLSGGRSAARIVVGLRYQSKVKQLRPPLTAQDGSHLGRLKSVPEAFIDVHEALGLKVGPEGAEAELLERASGEPMDQQVPLRTGSFKIHFPGGWRRNAELSIISEQPLPATIRAITRGLEVEP